MQYSAKIFEEPWETQEAYCTTKQFEKIGDKNYLRHCGPVAVTNLILTLSRFEKARGTEEKSDKPLKEDTDRNETELFCDVARTGQRMLIYHNIDFMGKIGGTSDLLVPLYLMRCFRKYGVHAHIGMRSLLNEKNVGKAIDDGNILYVEFRHHPQYGNHHLICYSAQELFVKKDSRKIGFYLKCADGWTGQPVYLSAEQIPFGSCFYSIRPQE